MCLRGPAARAPMRLEPLVAVWAVPLTGRPCRSGKEVIGVPHLSAWLWRGELQGFIIHEMVPTKTGSPDHIQPSPTPLWAQGPGDERWPILRPLASMTAQLVLRCMCVVRMPRRGVLVLGSSHWTLHPVPPQPRPG
jgi:hypothetical protein